jgi:hypothetical protein
MAGSLHSRKVRQWRRRMTRFEAARQAVAEFCRKEGVSPASFYHWRKRLAGPAAAGVGETDEAAGVFRPVRLVGAAGVAVHLPGGTRLEVPTADRPALHAVLELLIEADARRAGGGRC